MHYRGLVTLAKGSGDPVRGAIDAEEAGRLRRHGKSERGFEVAAGEPHPLEIGK